jgi:hypothetical protein
MKKEEAQALFAPHLTDKCEVCSAKPNELCDTESVWVHACRFVALRRK